MGRREIAGVDRLRYMYKGVARADRWEDVEIARVDGWGDKGAAGARRENRFLLKEKQRTVERTF